MDHKTKKNRSNQVVSVPTLYAPHNDMREREQRVQVARFNNKCVLIKSVLV